MGFLFIMPLIGRIKYGHFMNVAVLFVLFLRKSWVPRLFQVLLVLGAVGVERGTTDGLLQPPEPGPAAGGQRVHPQLDQMSEQLPRRLRRRISPMSCPPFGTKIRRGTPTALEGD